MALWIIPLLLQPIIAAAMIFRGQVRDFPVFFSYTLFVSGRDLLLLFLRSRVQLYALIYWAGEPITIILGVAVMYEVLWRLIRPYPLLRFLGVRLFWISLGIAALGGVLMLEASQFRHIAFSIESVTLLERSARFVEVGVLVAFIFFISRFGLTWKHYTAGIVAGFGIAAGLQLALFELESLHMMSDNIFVLSNSAAYDCAVLIWALYFVPQRMLTDTVKGLPESGLAEWDEVLRGYLRK